MCESLRSYGPGRYHFVVDAVVHEAMSVVGQDEQAGDVERGGWCGLVKDPFGTVTGSQREDGRTLVLDGQEIAFLAKQVGAIVVETNDGFVQVYYFDDEEHLAEAWRAILDDEEKGAES